RALIRVQLVELMLREIRDLELARTYKLAVLRLEAVGEELREGGFAVAVRAEERDAVVFVDAKVEFFQDRFSRLVADGNLVEHDDRRGKEFLRRANGNRRARFLDLSRERLHLGERLDARLRLARL